MKANVVCLPRQKQSIVNRSSVLPRRNHHITHGISPPHPWRQTFSECAIGKYVFSPGGQTCSTTVGPEANPRRSPRIFAPMFHERGLWLIEHSTKNLEAFDYQGVLAKDSYWRWPERNQASHASRRVTVISDNESGHSTMHFEISGDGGGDSPVRPTGNSQVRGPHES